MRDSILHKSSRPAMLQFSSTPVRWIKYILYGIPRLLGLAGEAQTVAFRIMEHQDDDTPTASIRILLEPKAGHLVGSGIPEIYDAEVEIRSQLPWPKETMRNWKWTTHVWLTFIIVIMEVMYILRYHRGLLLPSPQDLTEGVSRESETRRMKGPDDMNTKGTEKVLKRQVSFEDEEVLSNKDSEGSWSDGSRPTSGGGEIRDERATQGSSKKGTTGRWCVQQMEEVK